MTAPPADAWQLPAALNRRADALLRELLQPPGSAPIDFSRPAGEPALIAPDSVSWQVFKNPLTVFIGGVAAVILELAEPRVRAGVWEHTRFRELPLGRMGRTGLAAMMTVYGPRSQAEAMIERVNRLHTRVTGTTPQGEAYSALDPELLTWVHATASFGFLEAYAAWVRPLAPAERDRFYAEGLPAARLYGATAAPASESAARALFTASSWRLQTSPTLFEFLAIVERLRALPPPLRALQPWLVRAAVDLVPPWLRARLGLDARWLPQPWQRPLLRRIARGADRLLLPGSPAVQACRRLGLHEAHLYRTAP